MVSASAQASMLIDFHDITVMRDGKCGLDGLSLKIRQNENVAVVGPNGSGKSTLLKTITRELYPLARPGSYTRILGQDCWDLFELRDHFSVVANDLFATTQRKLICEEVVLSGYFGSIGIWPNHKVTAAMRQGAAAALEKLGAAHLARSYWTEVSSGEARRVMIARALVHDPQVLVLDEPSNSLDVAAFRELRGALRQLAQSGTNLILVTHHFSEIIPEISRVILLKDGKVFRDGPKQEILRAPVLSELFGIKIEAAEIGEYLHVW